MRRTFCLPRAFVEWALLFMWLCCSFPGLIGMALVIAKQTRWQLIDVTEWPLVFAGCSTWLLFFGFGVWTVFSTLFPAAAEPVRAEG